MGTAPLGIPLVYYGIVLTTIGSVGNNSGNNIVSIAHTQMEEKEREERRSAKIKCRQNLSSKSQNSDGGADPEAGCFESENDISTKNSSEVGISTRKSSLPPNMPKFEHPITMLYFGTFIFIFGNLFTFAAFALGSQSVLACMEGTQFISNVFWVKFVHKLPVTCMMWLSTLLIVLGTVCVVAFGNRNSEGFTSRRMLELWQTNTAFHIYLVFAVAVWLIALYVNHIYYKARMIERRLLWKHPFIESCSFAVSAAVIGTFAVMFSKCLALLFDSARLGHKKEFQYGYLYCNLGVWLICLAYWLNRLNRALQLYPPLFIIPVIQIFFILFAILCGGFYFEEFQALNTTQIIGFCVGVFCILFGVYGLAPCDMVLKTPEDDSDDEEVEGEEGGDNRSEVSSDDEEQQMRKEKEFNEYELAASMEEHVKPLRISTDSGYSPESPKVVPTTGLINHLPSAPTITEEKKGDVGNNNHENKIVPLQDQQLQSPFAKNLTEANERRKALNDPNSKNVVTEEKEVPSAKKRRKVVKRGSSVNLNPVDLRVMTPSGGEETIETPIAGQ